MRYLTGFLFCAVVGAGVGLIAGLYCASQMPLHGHRLTWIENIGLVILYLLMGGAGALLLSMRDSFKGRLARYSVTVVGVVAITVILGLTTAIMIERFL